MRGGQALSLQTLFMKGKLEILGSRGGGKGLGKENIRKVADDGQ